MTIEEQLGWDYFYQRRAGLRALQYAANVACGDEIAQSQPCSPDGEAQLHVSETSCYIRDFGCGHVCYNRFVESYKNKDKTT